jgi:hypothetical protein
MTFINGSFINWRFADWIMPNHPPENVQDLLNGFQQTIFQLLN